MQATDVLPVVRRIVTDRRMAALAVLVVVFLWALVELVSLAFRHTTGPEIYGVYVAGLAVVAGALSVLVLRSGQQRLLVTAAIVVLWAVVALGGVAGTWFHATGTGPEAGPVDPRPRPQGAPLIFSALGLVGGSALVYGQRTAGRTARNT